VYACLTLSVVLLYLNCHHVHRSVMDQLMLAMELCVDLTLTMMDSLMWVWIATYNPIALQYVWSTLYWLMSHTLYRTIVPPYTAVLLIAPQNSRMYHFVQRVVTLLVCV